MGSGPVGRGRRYARRFAGAMNRHSKACHRMPRTATVTQSAFPEPMIATPVFCGQCRRPRMSSSVFPPTVSFPVFQVFCLSACRSVPGFFPSPSIFPLEKGPPRVGPRGPRRPMARHRHRKPTEPKPSRNMPEEGGRAGNAGRRIPADAGVPASPASSPRVFRGAPRAHAPQSAAARERAPRRRRPRRLDRLALLALLLALWAGAVLFLLQAWADLDGQRADASGTCRPPPSPPRAPPALTRR